MKKIVLLTLLVFVLASCSSKKEILLFQGIENLKNAENLLEFEPVFQINDILHIKVNSLNPDVVAPFQMSSGGQSQTGGVQQNPSLMGYLIDVNGDIQFPVLGKVSAAGKSRSEFETYLTNEIHKYATDAVISVRLLNFRVVVLGEAGSQAVVNVENERISVPELLASVGGLSYDGKRQNILIIREVDGVRTFGRIDMTKANVFNNPFFYLKQNDIVYVEPTYRTVKSAGFITSYTGLISLATTIFGLVVLFTR